MEVLQAAPAPLQDKWASGILEFSTAVSDGQRFGARELVLQNLRADPTRGVIIALFRGQQELVMRAGQSSQAQPIQFEDAFEMREQHLNLLSITSRLLVLRRVGNLACDFP